MWRGHSCKFLLPIVGKKYYPSSGVKNTTVAQTRLQMLAGSSVKKYVRGQLNRSSGVQIIFSCTGHSMLGGHVFCDVRLLLFWNHLMFTRGQNEFSMTSPTQLTYGSWWIVWREQRSPQTLDIGIIM